MVPDSPAGGGPRSGTPGLPLYHQIKQALRATIATQDLDPTQPFITEREICERFGVSTTTAVRALNELVAEGVLVRRRGRGTFIAEQQPTPAAARPEPSRTVAYITHGQGPIRADILAGVQQGCADLGYRLLLFDSTGRPEREAAALREAQEAQVAGILLYAAEGQANLPLLRSLHEASFPVVMVDRYWPGLPTDAVVVDNYTIGHAVTEHLLERGHRTIATLWDETDCSSVRERLTGHVQALHERGLPIRPELTALTNYVDQSSERRLAQLRAFLAAADPPDVLLCLHGYVLATVVNDLIELGVAIPEQIDLASMDDAGPYDLLPLTVVAAVLPTHEMGQQGMRLLADRIANPGAPTQHVVLPARIKTRDSAPGHLRVVQRPRASGDSGTEARVVGASS